MLKDLNSDRRLFREIGGEFLKICDQPVSAIRNAAHSKNSAALIDMANAFKGMVSGYYAERLAAVAEALALLGKQENYDGVEAALDKLEKEVKLFTDDLRAAISYETTEAQDAISRKKADVLDLVEELRISVETTYTLKNAIQHRMDDLETRLSERDGEIAKLLEEFELLRETMRSTETLDAPPSSSLLQMVTEMKDKISSIEKEFVGEKEGLELTRKDMAGFVGMLKDFRKMFNTLIVRFSSHIAQHDKKKVPSGDKHDSQWLLKNYKFKGL
jgi:chromosome segregation ATPase